MKFKEFGDKNLPTFIMLHGGGLSWWSMEKVIDLLKDKFHIVTPIIDGHGEDGGTEFNSIEDSALKLINYIDKNYEGKVFAISGLSIGGQIVAEILSKRYDITEYAIIESALVYPMKFTSKMIYPMYNLTFTFIKKRWFAKLQTKILCVDNGLFEKYYEDSLKMSKQSLINMSLSNANYRLDESIKNTKAEVLIIVGGKELKLIKKSAERLNFLIPNSKLYIASNLKHGEFSLSKIEEYVYILKDFLAGEK